MSSIIDISQTLRKGIAVWPGDTPFDTFWVMQMANGDSCNVGSVTMSLHTGTHADAPLHFLAKGGSPVDADLDPYIGPAQVVDCTGSEMIKVAHIEPLIAIRPERVLFKTGSASPESFDSDFAWFSAEAARALVALGVVLIGIDTPSVDKSDSKTLESHKIFATASVSILENLVLDHVTPGTYELIALPLKLDGMDASPVRAILRTV